MYKEILGNLVGMGKRGDFDVIAHGCNCFCTMGAGIAPQMAEAFGCDNYIMEADEYRGDFNKLGTIDYEQFTTVSGKVLTPVNAYTQYGFGKNHKEGSSIPLDYDALTLCMRKMNHIFKGKTVGLPRIGCGLAGGDWNKVSKIIKEELKDCEVTVVIYPEASMFTFFWNGPFSNWHPSPFTINGMDFNCEEQHMMYWKAITFGDHDTATRIMETNQPAIQKALGRKVKNFDPEKWLNVGSDIVYKGLKAKFLQNPKLFAELKKGYGTTFVEASPVDRIWGIGYSEADALENYEDWGINILGNLLTKLSKELCSE